MKPSLFLLSTCGTSVLTNGASLEQRKWLVDIANRRGLDHAEQQRLSALLKPLEAKLLGGDEASQRRLSAELNGIGAALEQWQPVRIQHVLLHTDTDVGQAAAELVQRVLAARGQAVQLMTAGGLRTDDLSSFREALADVTRQLEAQDLPAYRSQGWTVVFNLTGGFKSVNGYLQALGMLYADQSVFLFERAQELMRIPRLPVRLAETEEVRAHSTVFRKLSARYPVSTEEAAGVPESLLLTLGTEVALSVWGEVVWHRAKGAVLAERLFEPLSPKLVLQPALGRAFEKYEACRRAEVNDALDQLSAHLDHGAALGRARTFRALRGDPRPPSTHELYAWSDGEAGRLFGHYEEGRFVMDALGRHL